MPPASNSDSSPLGKTDGDDELVNILHETRSILNSLLPPGPREIDRLQELFLYFFYIEEETRDPILHRVRETINSAYNASEDMTEPNLSRGDYDYFTGQLNGLCMFLEGYFISMGRDD